MTVGELQAILRHYNRHAEVHVRVIEGDPVLGAPFDVTYQNVSREHGRPALVLKVSSHTERPRDRPKET